MWFSLINLSSQNADICISPINNFMNNLAIVNKFSTIILGVVLIVSTSFKVRAQTNDDPLSTWDKSVLQQANTAESATYLSDEEKKLIFYTNLCRLQPKLFCQTVLADYLKNHPDQTKGILGLKRTLNANKNLDALKPDEEMSVSAHNYAKKMGEEGKEGHIDFQNRMKPFLVRFHAVGENCDYGNNLGLDAFMNLLIDSSDPVNLGHRKNLLDPTFKYVGVGGQPHKTYRWNYVMDFGG
jgi:uncharacterized protein YkwD